MKTKDGRSAYGLGRTCDCGRSATVKFRGYFVCERCYRIDTKNFTTENYCGEYSEETKERIKNANIRGGSSKSDKKRKASAKNVAIALRARWNKNS